MKQSVTFSSFVDAFRAHDRQDQFSYAALRVLFDEFEDYEEQTGSEVELDVIAICCEYVEMTTEEVIEDYNLNEEIDGLEDMDEEEQQEAVIEWLIDRTWFMGNTGSSLVFQQF